jgi:hypothetical protein
MLNTDSNKNLIDSISKKHSKSKNSRLVKQKNSL